MNKDEYWSDVASKLLLNKKIIHVRYMTLEEASELGWYKRSVVFYLEDKTMLYISMDDEGNDGGSMYFSTTEEQHGVLPTL